MEELVVLHNRLRADAKSALSGAEQEASGGGRGARTRHGVSAQDDPRRERRIEPSARIIGQGYRMRRCGENVAFGPRPCEAVMKGWMNSPPHKANILGNFTQIGAAYATAPTARPSGALTSDFPPGENSLPVVNPRVCLIGLLTVGPKFRGDSRFSWERTAQDVRNSLAGGRRAVGPHLDRPGAREVARGGRPRRAALAGNLDSNGAVAEAPQAKTVGYVDRHPMLSKPRDYWENAGDNKIVKAGAATFIGVPVGIYGELKQIVVGAPPETR